MTVRRKGQYVFADDWLQSRSPGEEENQMKRPGEKVRVRYRDGAWYPAVILRFEKEKVLVRWDPPDPNIPPTYLADEDDIQ